MPIAVTGSDRHGKCLLIIVTKGVPNNYNFNYGGGSYASCFSALRLAVCWDPYHCSDVLLYL